MTYGCRCRYAVRQPRKFCQAPERAGSLSQHRWSSCGGWATALGVGWQRCCQEDRWDCMLFTDARSMRRALRWSTMKPESGSGWFPLRSLPIFSGAWLRPPMATLSLKVKVTLRLTVSQRRAPSSSHKEMFVTAWWLLSYLCGAPSLMTGRGLSFASQSLQHLVGRLSVYT
jgi:hypothetical protein